jgi:hypothetical protein
MSDTAPAKIFQMHIDWTRFGQDWRNINPDYCECYYCGREFEDGEKLSVILTSLGNQVICHDCAEAYDIDTLDMEMAALCDSCVLSRMCERYRRVQDACIDPITPGRAIIVECEAYREDPRLISVLRGVTSDGGKSSTA